jgi:hypothetical protein
VSICLLDTSILCEILEVSYLCKDPAAVLSELEQKIKNRETLLLPLSTIVETGNHIGQNGDGQARRSAAERFGLLVRQALRGQTPFTPTPFFEAEELLRWLEEFPEWATRGSGLADLTIVKEWERQCQMHRSRHVYIWSIDRRHLSSFDRRP